MKNDSVDSDGNSEKRLGSFGKPKVCKEKEAEEEEDDETASCLGKKDLPTPKEIVKLLDDFVVGQERAKKVFILFYLFIYLFLTPILVRIKFNVIAF